MFTQCVECLTIYRVSAEQLKLGLGELRCGHCGHVFNALLTIVEQLPETAIDELPRAHVENLPPTLDVPVMHASRQQSLFAESTEFDDKPASSEWLSFTPAEATLDLRLESVEADQFQHDKNARFSGRSDALDAANVKEWLAEPTETSSVRAKQKSQVVQGAVDKYPSQDQYAVDAAQGAASKRQSSDELRDQRRPMAFGAARAESAVLQETFNAPARTQKSRPSLWLWINISVVLMLLLLGQLIRLQWPRLEQHPTARPVLAWFCQYADCKLAFQSDLEKFSLLDRDVKPHATAKGALLISATVRNDAPFTQTFPIVEVRLLDISRNLVAARRFFPNEYLQDESIQSAGFPADSTLPIVFEVLDPGKSAVNFEFAFLPPVSTPAH